MLPGVPIWAKCQLSQFCNFLFVAEFFFVKCLLYSFCPYYGCIYKYRNVFYNSFFIRVPCASYLATPSTTYITKTGDKIILIFQISMLVNSFKPLRKYINVSVNIKVVKQLSINHMRK